MLCKSTPAPIADCCEATHFAGMRSPCCALACIDEPARAAARSRIDTALQPLPHNARRTRLPGALGLVLALAALGAMLALSGCGSAPKRGGGFYQDDGPPRDVPRDLERAPDATPRVEPFHPFANRPYTALGRNFTPITDDRPLRQRGNASWYGRQFHGNRTAIGERYDMFAMTAAHPTMPLPSYARVTNTHNGASVIVRVNDRGPFLEGRVIDLSYAAATRLGFANAGTAEVEVVRLTHADIRAGAGAATAGATAAVASRAPLPPVSAPPLPAPPVATLPTPNMPAPTTPAARASGADDGGPWAVQLGAYSVAANAEALRERVALLLTAPEAAMLPPAQRAPRVERQDGVFRVLVGALASREDAQALAAQIERLLERDTALYRRP